MGIATPGAHQEALGGFSDLFLGKLSPDGATQVWGTYYGGSEQDTCGGAVLDAQALARLRELDPKGEVIVCQGDRASLEKGFAGAGIDQVKLIEPDYK